MVLASGCRRHDRKDRKSSSEILLNQNTQYRTMYGNLSFVMRSMSAKFRGGFHRKPNPKRLGAQFHKMMSCLSPSETESVFGPAHHLKPGEQSSVLSTGHRKPSAHRSTVRQVWSASESACFHLHNRYQRHLLLNMHR